MSVRPPLPKVMELDRADARRCRAARRGPGDARCPDWLRRGGAPGQPSPEHDFRTTHLRRAARCAPVGPPQGTNAQCALGQETTQAANTDPAVAIHRWEGWDAVLLEQLAHLGNFSYTIVSMGRSTDISQRVGG